MPEYRLIPYELLNEPPFPMREQFGDIPFDELVESIGKSGVQAPVLVRPVDGRFEIMDGHRRYKAAGVCALREVPCLVKECGDEEAFETMVAGNAGREDPTPTEEGRFYLGLMERFKVDEERVAAMLKKSVGYVQDRVNLVGLDENIANAVRDRQINLAVAKELLRVNPYTAALVLRTHVNSLPADLLGFIEAHRGRLLDLCVQSGATARVANQYVEQWKRSLMPNNPALAADQSAGGATPVVVPQPRCLVCGRDADPYNMREIRIHFYELDKVKAVLREAGFTLYE